MDEKETVIFIRKCSQLKGREKKLPFLLENKEAFFGNRLNCMQKINVQMKQNFLTVSSVRHVKKNTWKANTNATDVSTFDSDKMSQLLFSNFLLLMLLLLRETKEIIVKLSQTHNETIGVAMTMTNQRWRSRANYKRCTEKWRRIILFLENVYFCEKERFWRWRRNEF